MLKRGGRSAWFVIRTMGRGDDHRAWGMADHVVRDRSEHGAAEPASAPSADDDGRSTDLLRVSADRRRWVAAKHDPGRRIEAERSGDGTHNVFGLVVGRIDRHLEGISRHDATGDAGSGEERRVGFDQHDDDVRDQFGRQQSKTGTKRLGREFGTIGTQQDGGSHEATVALACAD